MAHHAIPEERAKVVVVLGGTSFMGRHLVEQLKASSARFYILNRGSSYWGDRDCDSNPFHLPMDRDDDVSVQVAFKALSMGLGNARFSVVDFSCDDEVFMGRVWGAMHANGLVSQLAEYVLISTDSVYENVRPKRRSPAGLREDGASYVSPSSSGYGGEKLRAEHALASQAAAIPAVAVYILRLPDVLGPFDNSGRYWATILWAQSGVPLLISEEAAMEKVSFVGGADIAALCARILFPSHSLPPVKRGSYNVACTETITMLDLLKSVALAVGVVPPRVFSAPDSDTASSSSESSDDESSSSCDYYPSVGCGPLCVAAAHEGLHWAPTPLGDVLAASTAFFMNAPRKGAEYRRALGKLPCIVRVALRAK